MDIFNDTPLNDIAGAKNHLLAIKIKLLIYFWFNFKSVEAFLTHYVFLCVLKTHFVYF